MRTLRAAAHVHSEWSYDGRWSLEALARAFARRGYDAVLLAEHDRGFDEHRWRAYREACAAASTPRTRLVPGIEYSDAANRVHVAVWGDLPFLGEGRPTREILAAADALGGAAVLAHPARRDAHMLVEPDWLERLAGIEVWNRKYDGWAPSAVAAALADSRPHLVGLAGLDFHTARQFFPLAMLFDLDAAVADEERLARALREGRCRPQAVGLPVERLASGSGYAAARFAERGRRSLARSVRTARAAVRR